MLEMIFVLFLSCRDCKQVEKFYAEVRSAVDEKWMDPLIPMVRRPRTVSELPLIFFALSPTLGRSVANGRRRTSCILWYREMRRHEDRRRVPKTSCGFGS